MNDIEFYTKLVKNPCEGCFPDSEDVEHCGVFTFSCSIFDMLLDLEENLLPFLGWDENIFLTYIKYKDEEELNFIVEWEEFEEEYFSHLEDICDDYYGNLY